MPAEPDLSTVWHVDKSAFPFALYEGADWWDKNLVGFSVMTHAEFDEPFVAVRWWENDNLAFSAVASLDADEERALQLLLTLGLPALDAPPDPVPSFCTEGQD